MKNELEEKLNKFLKENNMELGTVISSPVYRILPDEVKLALSVLSQHKMRILVTIKTKDKPKA